MNSSAGSNLVDELGSSRARFFETDVSDTDSIAAAVQGTMEWVKQTGKEVGGVVAAAGVGNPGKVSSIPSNKPERQGTTCRP